MSESLSGAPSPPKGFDWAKYHYGEYVNYFLCLIQGSRGSYKHTSNGVHLMYAGEEMWNSILLDSLCTELRDNLQDELASWLQFFYRNGSDHTDIYFPSDIKFRCVQYHLLLPFPLPIFFFPYCSRWISRDELAAELELRDFSFWSHTYGMELDLSYSHDFLVPGADPAKSVASTSFRIELLDQTDREKLNAFHTIVAENFLVGEEEGYREAFIKMRRQALEEPHLLFFLGFEADTPVCTATLSVQRSYLGIAQVSDISTSNGHRRKGFAKATLQFVSRYAKNHGFKWVALQGERDAAVSLYRSLGFQTSCQFEVWENLGT